jgi:hypothetical protein
MTDYRRYPAGPRRFAGDAAPDTTAAAVVQPAPAPAPEFLPLPIRRGGYVVALLLVVAAPIVAVSSPEYAAAILAAAAPLEAAALGLALANPSRR